VQRTLIRPPSSRIGPLTEPERQKIIALSPVAGQYDRVVDRESAFEILQRRAKESAEAEEQARQQEDEQGSSNRTGWTLPDFGGSRETKPRKGSRSGYQRQTVTETMIKSVVRTVGTTLGREIVRGILGSLKRGR